MNNSVMLIGRINNDIEKIDDEERTIYKLILDISRNFKNQDGEYEKDYIPIELTSNIGNSVFEYCQKGDLVGVRGRTESKDGKAIQIIAEKITFLSNRKLVNQN